MKRALSIIVPTVCLAIATAFSQLHENIMTGGNEDKTIITKAPSGQYSLIQTQANPALKSCEEAEMPCYQTTVHFQDNGLLVAICLSVDVAKDHRVLWVFVDTAAVAYVCLFNGWLRNHLLTFTQYLSKVEKR